MIKRIRNIKLSLFAKIILVTLSSLLISTILVVIVTINTGQNLYMETYSTSNLKTMNWITAELKNLNYKAVNLIDEYSANNLLRKYLSENIPQSQRFYSKYRINNIFFQINNTYGESFFDIFVAGLNNNYYTDNYIGINVNTVYNVHDLRFFNGTNTIRYDYRDHGVNGYSSELPSIIITKPLIDTNKNLAYGKMAISIRESEFCSVYDKYLFKGNNAIIIGKDGKILSSNIKRYVGQQRDDILSKAKRSLGSADSIGVAIDEKEYLMMARYFPDMDIYLVMLNDTSIIADAYSGSNFRIVIISLLVALITCTILLLIIRRTTNPLSKLIKEMEKAKDSNFIRKVPVEGGYEVKRLSKAYNNMVEELESYIEQLIKEQEQRRVAELSSLQMQINPHFMYNTLTSIKVLAKRGDSKAVDEMINAFISLLQNTISKTDELVTVKEEIDNLRNYSKINSLRYGDKIKVFFFIDERTNGMLVPKLILQPIMENAFFHAFSNKSNGEIKVFVTYVNEKLICEIIDNGDGILEDIDVKKSGFKRFSKGIGLMNIRERMKIIYGEANAHLCVQSTPLIGTSVKIIIENGEVKAGYN